MALSPRQKADLLTKIRRHRLPPKRQVAPPMPPVEAATAPTQTLAPVARVHSPAGSLTPAEGGGLPPGIRPEFAFQPQEYRRRGGQGLALGRWDGIAMMQDKIRQDSAPPRAVWSYDPYAWMRRDD
jgi:hypothetical protein